MLFASCLRCVGLLVFLFPLGFCSRSITQDEVSLDMALAEGKTQFRSGEPIILQLSFVASATGVSLNTTTTNPASPIDTVLLTPSEGAYPWLEAQARGNRYSPDYAAMTELTPNKPAVINLTLNDLYRFDSAGHYSVRVTTRRTGSELTSNEVSFDVVPFSEHEEADLAASLEQRIRGATNQGEAQRLANLLNYLPGDAATQAKLSLFLKPKIFYPFGIDVTQGLWIARNRAMVVAALEKAIADPAQENGAGSNMLGTLVALKESLESPYDPKKPGPRADSQKIQGEYLHQIALTIPQRSGDARIDAARTVFVALAQMKQTDTADFQTAREVLIAEFHQVNEYNVDWLLNSFGQYLIDPRIVPALHLILDNTAPFWTLNRAAALSQLAKVAPEEIDGYIVREACNTQSVSMQTVRNLSSSETLPQVNPCLKNKLAAGISLPNQAFDATMQYIARFADAALVPDVRQAYVSGTAKWHAMARGAAVTYLMRWAPQQTLPLLNELLPEHASNQQLGMMFELLDPVYPPADGLREIFRQRLKNDPSGEARHYPFALAQIGVPEDREFLRDQLQQLQKRNPTSLSSDDGRLEIELIDSILHGRAWQSTKEKTEALISTCVTRECKQQFQIH
jgi:hypothetical protein